MKLEKGNNQVRVHASFSAAGALNLSGLMRADNLGEIRFDRAMTLRRPKVLYISQDPEGTESHLMQTLSAAQFEVERTHRSHARDSGRLPAGGVEQSGSRSAAGRREKRKSRSSSSKAAACW